MDKLREFAIAALDDDEGLNKTAFDLLIELLADSNSSDIIDSVESHNGRFYLPFN